MMEAIVGIEGAGTIAIIFFLLVVAMFSFAAGVAFMYRFQSYDAPAIKEYPAMPKCKPPLLQKQYDEILKENDGIRIQLAAKDALIVQRRKEVIELKNKVESNDFWKDIVCTEDGKLNVEQVQKELCDYNFLLKQIPLIYCHVTGGLLSKPLYEAATIIRVHDDHVTKLVESEVKEAIAELKKD